MSLDQYSGAPTWGKLFCPGATRLFLHLERTCACHCVTDDLLGIMQAADHGVVP